MLLQVLLLTLAGWLLLRRKKVRLPVRQRVFEHSMAWVTLPTLLLLAAPGVWFMRGAHRVNVFRATKDLPAYKLLEEGDVEESRSPSPPTGAVRSKADVLGSITTSPVQRNALLTGTVLLKVQLAQGE